MMNYKNTGLVAALVALVLASGCANNKAQNQGFTLIPQTSDSLTVESTPAGAEVWIMGKREGTTPGTFPASLVFPRQFQPEDVGLYGRVRLVKTDCESVTLPVSTQALGTKMRVKLNCAASMLSQPAPVAPAAYQAPQVVPANPAMAVPAMPATAKERLLRLDELRRDGLINEEEYQNLRKRVLDTL